MKSRGYKILSSVLEYQNPAMEVYKKKVVYPDNKTKAFWVLHRLNFSIIIPDFGDGTTLLVGQYRIPVEYYSWEFPMGSVEGADPISTAKQELKEETGYTAKNWGKIAEYHLAPGHNTQKVAVFVASDLTAGKSQPEPSEFLLLKRVKFSEVKEMIRDGKIKDGPTVTAFYYFLNRK